MGRVIADGDVRAIGVFTTRGHTLYRAEAIPWRPIFCTRVEATNATLAYFNSVEKEEDHEGGGMIRSNEERWEDSIARTMARSEYPLAWFEGYPRVLFEKIKQYRDWETDRKSTRLNSSHSAKSRMPSSA